MRKILLAALALYPLTAIADDDHLVPERSVLEAGHVMIPYYSRLASTFEPILEREVEARAVVIPAFIPEYAVGVRHNDNTYTLLCHRAQEHIWRARRDVKANRYEAVLQASLAQHILSLWQTMLRQTRYPKEMTLVADGVLYHFASVVDHMVMEGTAWSPPQGSKPGALAAVVEGMQKLCDGQLDVRELETRVDAALSLVRR